jgi:hypothetical protein
VRFFSPCQVRGVMNFLGFSPLHEKDSLLLTHRTTSGSAAQFVRWNHPKKTGAGNRSHLIDLFQQDLVNRVTHLLEKPQPSSPFMYGYKGSFSNPSGISPVFTHSSISFLRSPVISSMIDLINVDLFSVSSDHC